MDRIVAQIELPSSNKAEEIHRFIDEINRLLEPKSDVEVILDWRSNRRFLSLEHKKGS